MQCIIAPPRSGLRMRTLRGGARNYVEKTIKTREGSDPTLSNSTYFQGARLTTRVSSTTKESPSALDGRCRRATLCPPALLVA